MSGKPRVILRPKYDNWIEESPDFKRLLELLGTGQADPARVLDYLHAQADDDEHSRENAQEEPGPALQGGQHEQDGREQGMSLPDRQEARAEAPGGRERGAEPGIPPFSISKLPG